MQAQKPQAVTWVGWNRNEPGTATRLGDSSGMSLINLSQSRSPGHFNALHPIGLRQSTPAVLRA